jgi:DNA-binding MarR family transcriptional regulator
MSASGQERKWPRAAADCACTLELEDLQTFVEVADAGGVSPAARRLGVSKSIVSRRLARLEEELGLLNC